MSVLAVTGGAGFIGSHFCELAMVRGHVVRCIDKLTYAGSRSNIAALEGNDRFSFLQADIGDAPSMRAALRGADALVNFAAETHVDRSILDPAHFATTDVLGLAVLLGVARELGVRTTVQVSTDEVYGPVPEGEANEDAPLRPASPYAAAKAGGDLLAQSFHRTYGMDVRVTRGCNALGPRQHPEKLVALMITRALRKMSLPVYGDGRQVREWLWVGDHASAVLSVLERGVPGDVYNVGSGERVENRALVESVLDRLGASRSLISSVEDRPGHDRRYALDSSRLRGLGWRPSRTLQAALNETVDWYRAHQEWWQRREDESREYFQAMYDQRERTLERLRGQRGGSQHSGM